MLSLQMSFSLSVSWRRQCLTLRRKSPAVGAVECSFLCALYFRFYSRSEGHEPTLLLIKTTAKEVSEVKGTDDIKY